MQYLHTRTCYSSASRSHANPAQLALALSARSHLRFQRGVAPKVQAPQAAVGFRVVVQKWLVLVRLLLGEVPERQELIEADLERPLRPYFQLTNAVRVGDLTAFRCAHVAATRAIA